MTEEEILWEINPNNLPDDVKFSIAEEVIVEGLKNIYHMALALSIKNAVPVSDRNHPIMKFADEVRSIQKNYFVEDGGDVARGVALVQTKKTELERLKKDMNNFNEIEFQNAKDSLIKNILFDNSMNCSKKAVILCGQPGAGKSAVARQIKDHYHIDGDAYRCLHPDYDDYIENIETMPEATQAFSNCMVESLISDLSDKGVNLIVEGTLRDSNVPLKTYCELAAKGYRVQLYVISASAVESWKSTIERAAWGQKTQEVGRLVPLEKYDYIVNHLAENLAIIESQHPEVPISIVSRNNELLFPSNSFLKASEVVKKNLGLDRWKELYPKVEEMCSDNSQANLNQISKDLDAILDRVR